MTSVIGLVHLFLRSLTTSQTTVDHIAKDPNRLRMVVMLFLLLRFFLRVRSCCRKLGERLDQLVLESDYGEAYQQNLVKLKLIRNACSLDVFTVRVWNCFELKEEFATETLKSVLLYGVTLYQVGA